MRSWQFMGIPQEFNAVYKHPRDRAVAVGRYRGMPLKEQRGLFAFPIRTVVSRESWVMSQRLILQEATFILPLISEILALIQALRKLRNQHFEGFRLI